MPFEVEEMSFDKFYPNRKDWRSQYRGAASFDSSCRPHGSCPFCLRKRTYREAKEIERMNQEERDWNVISDARL